MRLVRLSLTNFRLFSSLSTELSPGPTVIIGPNAQGKTSLLEAIYFLVGATSPHAGSDRQLIHLDQQEHGSPPVARLEAEADRDGEPLTIEIALVLDQIANGSTRLRKEITVNGLKRRAVDLHGQFNAVLFLPQDLLVIEGSPGRRRDQLDAVLSQAEPEYARALSEYRKVLTQRNALLKNIQERRSQPGELNYWDVQLTAHGASLMTYRAQAALELRDAAVPVHSQLTGGTEQLEIRYLPSVEGADPAVALGTELLNRRDEEIRRGVTIVGPQRDDLEFTVNGFDLRAYGSRGQGRTAMLAFKLAQVDWLKGRTGQTPVLLLDEVLAELDPSRREHLLRLISESDQALITAADPGMFEDGLLELATVWRMDSGVIRRD